MANKLGLILLLTLGWAGCASDPSGRLADESVGDGDEQSGDGDAPSVPQGKSAALLSLDSCDALAQAIRERSIASARVKLAEARQKGDAGCQGRDAGVSYAPVPASMAGSVPVVSTPAPVSESQPSEASAPTQVSQTNNQVASVDEADIVKTEGSLMYVVSKGALFVLQAWPASEARLVDGFKFGSGRPLKLFVQDGRAVLYLALGGVGSSRECTYGYDCDFTGDGSSTRVLVLDVRDPKQPSIEREFTFTGSLLAARRIGSTVHTVVSDRAVALEPTLPFCGLAPAQRDQALAAAEASYIERVSKLTVEQLSIPRITDSRQKGASLLAPCSGFYAASAESYGAYTTLFSFDLTDAEPATSATILSRPGAIYMSEDSLYMAVRDQGTYGAKDEDSAVHRFAVGDEPSSTHYAASGRVPGHALNQFAMDEHDGALRIATTSGKVPDPDVSSNLSVLQQTDAELRVLGQVRGIAKTEDIRSVRFDGARGYVVTFKKTDPLYVFDLSDKAAPRIAGELKIPGFSTYMQPLGDDHLLTIGYDADDKGSFAYFAGVLLQIFDVSNPARPTLAHKEVIGTRGTSSEALTNHLAFNYFAPKKLLALPMTICEGGGVGTQGTNMTFSGLMLYDIDVATGFKERGRVAHPGLAIGAGGTSYDSARCSNWWSDASSAVQRSVFMDDFVYSVASDVVRVQSLNGLGSDVATVPLSAPVASCEVAGVAYADNEVVPTAGACAPCYCRGGLLDCETNECSML